MVFTQPFLGASAWRERVHFLSSSSDNAPKPKGLGSYSHDFSLLNYLQKAISPNTVTLRVTALTYEFKDAVISSATTSGGVTTLDDVDFKAKLNKATGTTFNCNVNLDNTGITAAANALDLSGCTFKGTLVIDAEYAKLNGCTFDGSVTAASLKELNLYGTVNINNTFTTAVATTLTIGYGNSTDGFTASTITLNGDVTAASLTTVTVLKSAKLIVNVGNKLSAKAATAYTVNGTVSNYGKIQGNATVTLGENAKWSGDKPVASI